MDTFILLFIIILVSAALQSSTGFGFSILTVPLLLLIYDVHDAVKINNILSILLSAIMIYSIRKEIDRGLLKRLLLGSVLCMPVGLLVFLYMPIEKLKMATGIFILLFTCLLLFQFRLTASNLKDRVVGGLSGFLSTAIGIPGPPLLAYSSAISMDKKKLRSTTLAFYIVIYSVSFILQLIFNQTSEQVWISGGMSVPFVIIGIVIGQWLFKHINQMIFRRICLVILFITGIQLVYSSM
jgi:uncharacterized membrane protein YfcA